MTEKIRTRRDASDVWVTKSVCLHVSLDAKTSVFRVSKNALRTDRWTDLPMDEMMDEQNLFERSVDASKNGLSFLLSPALVVVVIVLVIDAIVIVIDASIFVSIVTVAVVIAYWCLSCHQNHHNLLSDASSHLYNRVCPSIRPSVHPSVCNPFFF